MDEFILAFCEQNPVEAREILDTIRAELPDAERRAAVELFREWATNPDFREELSEMLYEEEACQKDA